MGVVPRELLALVAAARMMDGPACVPATLAHSCARLLRVHLSLFSLLPHLTVASAYRAGGAHRDGRPLALCCAFLFFLCRSFEPAATYLYTRLLVLLQVYLYCTSV